MSRTAAKIQCSNPHCLTVNSGSENFCQKCGIPLVRRYLWVVGTQIETYKPGTLVGSRYLFQSPRIVLDTQPASPPQTPEEVPDEMIPYLKLSPYRLRVPQVYGQLSADNASVWLLEYGTLPIEQNYAQGELFSALSSQWQSASALRQINWLWQMADLWTPLQNQGVVSSLLNREFLRVKGTILQLRELQLDNAQTPQLSELANFWSELIPETAPEINNYLTKLCSDIQQNKISTPEEIIQQLDKAAGEIGKKQPRSYNIYTRTDRGVARDHNEDACYPSAEKAVKTNEDRKALAIVCDGIGGHEGGEIASQLAIGSVYEGVQKNLNFGSCATNPEEIKQQLETFICNANDAISQRNDSEQRQERRRMGTTLVMSLPYAHEIYIAHVGDSRVYWLSRSGCYQVTLDDDVASREVRLGYALYRDAIQYHASGSLVQALGMSSSANLRPTVQRFILDEDCVFLLCSDGLSDNDRVEQYWEKEILPILEGKTDVTQVGDRLIKIANQRNGHDNITVALVHCQVQNPETTLITPVPYQENLLSANAKSGSLKTKQLEAKSNQNVTLQPNKARKKKRNFLFLPLIVLLLLGAGAGVWLFLNPIEFRSLISNVPGISPQDSTSEPADSEIAANEPSATETPESPVVLEVGSRIEISEAIALQPNPAASSEIPNKTNVETNSEGISVPAQSILEVVAQTTEQVQLKVCQLAKNVPETTTSAEAENKVQLDKQPKTSSPSPDSATTTNPSTKPQITTANTGWIDANDPAIAKARQFPATDTVGECSAAELGEKSEGEAKPETENLKKI
ncbi:MAG: protein phosphatase 2C domain-containing protein [Oscillatoria sp. PMC 1068.18]|nr:protein phosphatase 2C domain-containing protein [Oscillatoria sp. PMC 1076.18]MEC4988970.1 protein phosphatase 2C domain-containing protein [Oscillatoria sp. PMC 1068.18]